MGEAFKYVSVFWQHLEQYVTKMPYARFSVFIKPDIRKCQNLQEELSGQRREAKRLKKIILKNNNSYLLKQQTVQGALWLATQTPNIYWYSLPSNSQGINAQKHCNRCSNIWYKIIFSSYVISLF